MVSAKNLDLVLNQKQTKPFYINLHSIRKMLIKLLGSLVAPNFMTKNAIGQII
jgi:hypothetical protein